MIRAILILSVMLQVGAVSPAHAQPETVDWAQLRAAYQQYVSFPSSSNADIVTRLLPSRPVMADTALMRETLEFIYEEDNMALLERQVISRNPSAVRLAFGFLAIADGGFAEDTAIILGQLIRIDPQLFLQELSSSSSSFDKRVLVGIQGEVYVDRPKAQCLERLWRRRALLSVTTPELQRIRDECLAAIPVVDNEDDCRRVQD